MAYTGGSGRWVGVFLTLLMYECELV
jgi:hypothetical protein